MRDGVPPPDTMLVDHFSGNVVEVDESTLCPGLNASEGKDEYKFKLSGVLLTDREEELDEFSNPKRQQPSDIVWDEIRC